MKNCIESESSSPQKLLLFDQRTKKNPILHTVHCHVCLCLPQDVVYVALLIQCVVAADKISKHFPFKSNFLHLY